MSDEPIIGLSLTNSPVLPGVVCYVGRRVLDRGLCTNLYSYIECDLEPEDWGDPRGDP